MSLRSKLFGAGKGLVYVLAIVVAMVAVQRVHQQEGAVVLADKLVSDFVITPATPPVVPVK